MKDRPMPPKPDPKLTATRVDGFGSELGNTLLFIPIWIIIGIYIGWCLFS